MRLRVGDNQSKEKWSQPFKAFQDRKTPYFLSESTETITARKRLEFRAPSTHVLTNVKEPGGAQLLHVRKRSV